MKNCFNNTKTHRITIIPFETHTSTNHNIFSHDKTFKRNNIEYADTRSKNSTEPIKHDINLIHDNLRGKTKRRFNYT